ncbi:Crp/Fnr family transcriptional regulator [Saccharicrinis sp. FJH62]|uniref:Crp/Fnr family transcriptional regulator n=1 Tax=Saccharicrinis sp. FJH62 TaxID=3344657 RepID=UPI0035D45405
MAERSILHEASISLVKQLWELLNEEQKVFVSENYQVHHFKKNQIIYKEGEQPDYLLCLVKGKVKIFKEGVGGRGQIVRMVKAPGIFGKRALFAGEEYTTSSICIEESVIITIHKDILMEVLHHNVELSLFFLGSLAKELGFSNNLTVSLTQKHIRGRLAEALLFLKETYGLESDGVTLNIYLSREDLANLSNMTTSNAIRTLSNFATEKVISVDGRKVKILNEEALKRISNLG